MLCVNEEIDRPDSFQNLKTKIGSPVESATRRPIKRNKELAETSYQEFQTSSKPGCRIYLFRAEFTDS
jgi:hypothetical protein